MCGEEGIEREHESRTMKVGILEKRPMFYKVDSTRLTVREYAWSVSILLLPILLLLKLLRIRLRIPMSYPDRLGPFLVDAADLPENVRARMEPLEAEMRGCGFVDPAYHWICDPFSTIRTCLATFRHQSGTVLGQITFRQSGSRRPQRETVVPSFLTSYRDGTFLVSTGGRRETLTPPGVKVQRDVGASVSELWRRHNEEASLESFGKTIIRANSREEMLALTEQCEAVERDFHIQRRVLVPCEAAEQQTIEAVLATPGGEIDREFAAVYAEVERLANAKASRLSGILTLLASIAIFFALGRGELGWSPLLLIAGVLFFHEMGHLAAMRLFHYRNLRMFFIPFLGAAVTGQNYNVPGWKKAVVSLMGPLPGIVLGAALGTTAALCQWPNVMWAAFFLLAINAFNLLPIMPLDGGQFMHAVVFSRHPLLDTAFRAIAAVLLLLSGLTGMRWLPLIGVSMLIGLPTTYRLGSVVRRLRKQGFDASSHDARTIPLETARRIHDELRQALPGNANARTTAKLTLGAFESLNARPPGWLASLALIGVHGASLLAVVVVVVAIVLIRHGLGPMRQPQHAVDCSKVLDWQGAASRQAARSGVSTIIATFPNDRDANVAYRDLTAELPPRAAATLFGQTVMVTLPAADDEARGRWFNLIKAQCNDVFVQRADARADFAIACTARSGEAAKQLAEEANAYLRMPAAMRLTPPWSPEQRTSERDRKARRTYQAIRACRGEGSSDKRWTALTQELADAVRRGDVQAVKRLRGRQKQLLQDIHKEQIGKLRAGGDAKWDIALLDLYEKSPEPPEPWEDAIWEDVEDMGNDPKAAAAMAARGKEIERWQSGFGSHLGQLPMDGNVPVAGADRYSTVSGIASSAGQTVRLDVVFERPSDGARTLAVWLSKRGVRIKYDIRPAERAEEDD
jgi:Zn-dependent protease